jgi:hypothetical protein
MSDNEEDSNAQGQDGADWHLIFKYSPDLPSPFPIVPAGIHPKHEPVGHLSSDGCVHVFNTEIIEQLVRSGLRMCVSENGTKSDGGKGG